MFSVPSRRSLVCALLLNLSGAALNAAPSITVVRDVLYNADGTLFDGVAQIDWETFRAADGTQIPKNRITVAIARGLLRVSLVPTTNAQQPVWYSVTFSSAGRTRFVETWAVPPSSAPLMLREVRTDGRAGNVTQPSGPATIGDVPGLRTELDLRPARGAGWVTGRAAVIGSSGSIEAAAGFPTDCVRVDGTSGPCGAGALLFADAEVPQGIMNGVNSSYLLASVPSPPESLQLYRNGTLAVPVEDYTLSGNTVQFRNGLEPQSGDTLLAWYRTSGPVSTIAELETPAGALDGLNAVFILRSPPAPAASLQLYRNGLLQQPGADFTLSGAAITFYDNTRPQPGDILRAIYRR